MRCSAVSCEKDALGVHVLSWGGGSSHYYTAPTSSTAALICASEPNRIIGSTLPCSVTSGPLRYQRAPKRASKYVLARHNQRDREFGMSRTEDTARLRHVRGPVETDDVRFALRRDALQLPSPTVRVEDERHLQASHSPDRHFALSQSPRELSERGRVAPAREGTSKRGEGEGRNARRGAPP